MQFIGKLNVGDRFRVAHKFQKSLNYKQLDRGVVYEVTRKFEQSPHLVIFKDAGGAQYSLRPDTPTLYPSEPNPTDEAIARFLSPSAGRKKVVGYRMLWDGEADLRPLLSPLGRSVIRALFVVGSRTMEASEAHELLREHLPRFLERGIKMPIDQVLLNYRRYLVDKGLLAEIVDEKRTHDRIVLANLQEELRGN